MPNETPDVGALAEELLASTTQELGLNGADLPQAARDAADDFAAAVRDQIGVGRQLKADLSDLQAKRDLLPAAGASRLRGEAVQEAQRRADEADGRAGRALEALRASLEQAALPRLPAGREGLARAEAELAIGAARGDAAVASAVRVAKDGSREAAAALLSPWGRTLLKARGVSGRSLEDGLARARAVATATSVERSADAGEIIAASVLARVGKLGAVKGAAGAFTIGMIRRST